MSRVVPGVAMGFAAVFIAARAAAQTSGFERYESDTAASRVTVQGTSTVHHWMVEGRVIQGSLILSESDRVLLWTNTDSASVALTPTVHVEIPVASLKSGKRGMDETMQTALKAQAHPTIAYHLEAAKPQTVPPEDGPGGTVTIETRGVLMVAGAERTVDVPMRVKRLSHDALEVSGETALRMTDFGVDPPAAMLGMLRTGDTVHVHWTWVLARRQPADDETRKTPAP